MEEPINVHPGRVGSKKGHPKASKVGVPAGINENVRLGECEGETKEVGKGTHDLNILMDRIRVV